MNYELNRYHAALVLWHDDTPAEQVRIPSGASAVWVWAAQNIMTWCRS